MFKGARPTESVAFTLWRDAEGSTPSRAAEHCFLQREVKVMRFWRGFDRGPEHLLTFRLWRMLTACETELGF